MAESDPNTAKLAEREALLRTEGMRAEKERLQAQLLLAEERAAGLAAGLVDKLLRAVVAVLRRRHPLGGAFNACKRALDALSDAADADEGASVQADTLAALAPHVALHKDTSIARAALDALKSLAAGAPQRRARARARVHACPMRALPAALLTRSLRPQALPRAARWPSSPTAT